jgi:hypothetical protein
LEEKPPVTSVGLEGNARPGTPGFPVENRKLIGDVVFVAIFGYASYVALDYPSLARTFPLCIGLLATLLSLVNLAIDLNRKFSGAAAVRPPSQKSHLEETIEAEMEDLEALGELEEKVEKTTTRPLDIARAWGWIFGFALATWLVGLVAATALFILTVLKIEARKSYLVAVIGAALATAGVIAFSKFLDVPLPEPAWWPF